MEERNYSWIVRDAMGSRWNLVVGKGDVVMCVNHYNTPRPMFAVWNIGRGDDLFSGLFTDDVLKATAELVRRLEEV